MKNISEHIDSMIINKKKYNKKENKSLKKYKQYLKDNNKKNKKLKNSSKKKVKISPNKKITFKKNDSQNEPKKIEPEVCKRKRVRLTC